MQGKCLQYGLFSNCSNRCQFCLIRERTYSTLDEIIHELQKTIENIDVIDWENEFSAGISILGGEVYYIDDVRYQEKFLELIDKIIEKVLKVSKNPICRYSSVTNGIYEPSFLFKVMDRIKQEVGMGYVDISFSYDLKYRYETEEIRLLVLDNINKFHKRYEYRLGVQMILTQYLIEMIRNKEFDINKFEQEVIPGNWLALLYPHKPNTGIDLPDFYLKRKDFLWFYNFLKNENPRLFYAFTESTRNSQSFKPTGLFLKGKAGNSNQRPVLSGGKELRNPDCGHSLLYQCYVDSDRCMLCDMEHSQ